MTEICAADVNILLGGGLRRRAALGKGYRHFRIDVKAGANVGRRLDPDDWRSIFFRVDEFSSAGGRGRRSGAGHVADLW